MVKSNYIIEASYKLSLQEQRLIYLLTSKIEKNDFEFKPYRFSIKEIAYAIGSKHKNMYFEINKCIDNLRSRSLTIIKEKSILKTNWLSSAEYFIDEGTVELCFDPKLKPYLLQLKNRFTKLDLEQVIKFNSHYSCRIYELLKQYERIGSRIFTIEELRIMFCIEDNEYPLYADFKRRVIIQSQKEINKKTDIHFEIEQIKTGRKVTQLKFIIKTNSKILKDDAKYIEEIKNIFDEDITAANAEKIYRAANKNMDIIKEKYILLQQQKDIKNVVGWIIKAIKEDYKTNEVKGKIDSFNDYEQRDYDYDDLEKKLLGLG